MINLKLAEYNAEGKFERFLELGKDFEYGGNYIRVLNITTGIETDENGIEKLIMPYFLKDPKDPLNRFDGLFDGRTYGDGRFVLIIDDQDDLLKHRSLVCDMQPTGVKEWADFCSNHDLKEFVKLRETSEYLCAVCESEYIEESLPECFLPEEDNLFGFENAEELLDAINTAQLIGNLHENPELYSKIK